MIKETGSIRRFVRGNHEKISEQVISGSMLIGFAAAFVMGIALDSFAAGFAIGLLVISVVGMIIGSELWRHRESAEERAEVLQWLQDLRSSGRARLSGEFGSLALPVAAELVKMIRELEDRLAEKGSG